MAEQITKPIVVPDEVDAGQPVPPASDDIGEMIQAGQTPSDDADEIGYFANRRPA